MLVNSSLPGVTTDNITTADCLRGQGGERFPLQLSLQTGSAWHMQVIDAHRMSELYCKIMYLRHISKIAHQYYYRISTIMLLLTGVCTSFKGYVHMHQFHLPISVICPLGIFHPQPIDDLAPWRRTAVLPIWSHVHHHYHHRW